MTNPITKNYKTKLLYVGIWAALSCIQITVWSFFIDKDQLYSSLDLFFFNAIFALLILPVWYLVRFNYIQRQSWFYYVLPHIVIAIAIITIAILLSALILVIISWNTDYHVFKFLPWKLIQGCAYYTVIVLVYYLITFIERTNEHTANEIRLNQIAKDAELNMLKSQINPHFVFNSLNSVNSLILVDKEKAQAMIVKLSDFLRYTVMSTQQPFVTFKQEIANAERYLAIEKLRFGDKLKYTVDCEKHCCDKNIPSLLLQPLLENAIKHGVGESLQTVEITIKAYIINQNFIIEIINDFDANSITPKSSTGTGLRNVRARLKLLYDDKSSIKTRKENNKYHVIITIPE